jgi:hypothetical protein
MKIYTPELKALMSLTKLALLIIAEEESGNGWSFKVRSAIQTHYYGFPQWCVSSWGSNVTESPGRIRFHFEGLSVVVVRATQTTHVVYHDDLNYVSQWYIPYLIGG